MSRIRLLGLVHSVSVIRKADSDDGSGGIIPGGAETTVYSAKDCRISALDTEKDEMMGEGFSAARNRKVVMEYAPKVVRHDFVRVPWGTAPNEVTPVGLADGTPPVVDVTTATIGTVTLTWTVATSVWATGDARLTLTNNAGIWRLQNSDDAVDVNLGAAATANPFNHASFVALSGYSANQTVSTIDYRIVWKNPQIDDVGDDHHTSLVIELEDEDT